MSKKFFIGNNFQDVYVHILYELYHNPEFVCTVRGTVSKEITNLSLEITNPLENIVSLKGRKFNREFAQRFFDWIMRGSSNLDELQTINKHVIDYSSKGILPKNFSTAYGPRIIRQLPKVLELLKQDPGTRRAVIHILEDGDKIIWDADTTIEYPCTNYIQLMIRDGLLHMYVGMRSNNMVLTICYDIYNFTHLQKHIAEQLGIGLGAYHHNVVSAHYFEQEENLVLSLLEEAQR